MIKISRVSIDYNSIPKGTVALFFGPPKTGKTTTACQWSDKGTDGTVVIDTDLGTDYIEGLNRIVVRDINPPTRVKTDETGKELLSKDGFPIIEEIPMEERMIVDSQGETLPSYALSEVIEALLSGDEELTKYDTIVVDTIDEINSWIEADVLRSRGLTAMGDGDFGVDWSEAKKRMKRTVEILKNYVKESGKTLILISHAKSKTEGKVTTILPDLPSGLGNVVAGMCDLIAYIFIDEKGKHKMSFKGTQSQTFGSRLKPLVGKVLDLGYQHFVKEITNWKKEN